MKKNTLSKLRRRMIRETEQFLNAHLASRNIAVSDPAESPQEDAASSSVDAGHRVVPWITRHDVSTTASQTINPVG